jgi:ABC-type Fe3+-hydroxamate transport system substrate-binding protein
MPKDQEKHKRTSKLKERLDAEVDGLIAEWEEYRLIGQAWLLNEAEDAEELIKDAKQRIAKARRRVFRIGRDL